MNIQKPLSENTILFLFFLMTAFAIPSLLVVKHNLSIINPTTGTILQTLAHASLACGLIASTILTTAVNASNTPRLKHAQTVAVALTLLVLTGFVAEDIHGIVSQQGWQKDAVELVARSVFASTLIWMWLKTRNTKS